MNDLSDGPPLRGWRRVRHALGQRARGVTNLHRPGARPDVMLFAMPRGGSTWLYELIASQPGFKGINEPLNVRVPAVRDALGIRDWDTLYGAGVEARLIPYLQGLTDGSSTHMNPNVWSADYRPLTDRTLLKMLHGAEHLAPQLQDALGAKVAVLLRHPIPVALSRTVLPRLDACLGDAFLEAWASPDEIAHARRVAAEGDALERSVLAWCLQTCPLLRQRREDWAVVTYEQLVVDGSAVVARVADRLELPDPARMLSHLHRPSMSIRGMSSARTIDELASRPSEARSLWLVRKWREKVDAQTEARVMRVLEPFGIDAYQSGSLFPNDSLWVDLRRGA